MSSSKKKKSIFDDVREGAKKGAERLSLGDQLNIARQKEQEAENGQGQLKDTSRSIEDQVGISYRSTKGQVSTNKQNEIESVVLAPQQQKAYEWFLFNGEIGYFNKGVISRETGIKPPTLRKCITKLKALSLIFIGEYDPASRKQSYKLNPEKKVTLLGSSKGQLKVRSSVNFGSSKGQLSLRDLSVSDFWIEQGLAEQTLQEWLKEFKFSDEELEHQLMFGANNPKVKNAEKPIGYFYKLLQQGGLTRPEGFEFPEERRLRIKKENIEARQKTLEEAKKIQEQERELADQESLVELLSNKEAIADALTEVEKNSSMTTKLQLAISQFKKNGQVNSILINRLKSWLNAEKMK